MKTNLPALSVTTICRSLNYRLMLITFSGFLIPAALIAQVPVFNYDSPQVYKPGVAITPLALSGSGVAAAA